MKLKETAEDIAVKDKLFDSSMAEVIGFATKHADRHEVGAGETDGQKDILSAAKSKGYQMKLIRRTAMFIRRGRTETIAYDNLVSEYRNKLGL